MRDAIGVAACTGAGWSAGIGAAGAPPYDVAEILHTLRVAPVVLGNTRAIVRVCSLHLPTPVCRYPVSVGEHALNDLVLIVDDAPNIVGTVSFLLESAGFPTVTAADGQEGLGRARMHHPRVAVIDASMPVMDGYDMCRALRAEPALAAVYVVFMTGEEESAIRRRAMEAGADLYMQKPLDTDALAGVVAEVFSGARSHAGATGDIRMVARARRRRLS